MGCKGKEEEEVALEAQAMHFFCHCYCCPVVSCSQKNIYIAFFPLHPGHNRNTETCAAGRAAKQDVSVHSSGMGVFVQNLFQEVVGKMV